MVPTGIPSEEIENLRLGIRIQDLKIIRHLMLAIGNFTEAWNYYKSQILINRVRFKFNC